MDIPCACLKGTWPPGEVGLQLAENEEQEESYRHALSVSSSILSLGLRIFWKDS